jgi:hypothetical protein
MTDRFLPNYGLYLLNQGVRPETQLVFLDLPVNTEEAGQDCAICFDFTGLRDRYPVPPRSALSKVQQDLYERFVPLIVQPVTIRL